MPAKTELMYGNTQRFQRQTSQVGHCENTKGVRFLTFDDIDEEDAVAALTRYVCLFCLSRFSPQISHGIEHLRETIVVQ